MKKLFIIASLCIASLCCYSQYYLPDIEDIRVEFPRTKKEIKRDIKERYRAIRQLNKALINRTGQDWKNTVDANKGVIDKFLYDLAEITYYHYDKSRKSSLYWDYKLYVRDYAMELLKLIEELKVDKLSPLTISEDFKVSGGRRIKNNVRR